MATRLISLYQHLLIYQRQSFRSLSSFIRFLSNQNRDPSESAEQPSNPAKIKNTELKEVEPISKWLNIRAGIFGPDDERLPLPGDIGLSQNLAQVEQNYQSDIRTYMSRDLSNSFPDFMLTTQERAFKKIHEAQENYKNIMESALEEVDCEEMNLECRVQECPKLLKKDFAVLFPDIILARQELSVITLCQKTQNDMSGWSEEVETEREELMSQFVDCAHKICDSLRSDGYWADFIDPSSGRPYLGAFTNSTFFETDERYRHLGFKIEDLGCCKVISHRTWGTNIFVGAIFCNVPVRSKVIEDTLNSFKLNYDT